MSVGFKIRQLRENKDWSQPELAYKLGLSSAALSNIENNKTRKIDFQLMIKICYLFEVEIEYFLDKKDTYNFKKDIDFEVEDNFEKQEIRLLKNILKRIEVIENHIKLPPKNN